MGLLSRQDSKIYRHYFDEMCKLIGISVLYQYVTERNMTIHSENNNNLSAPVRVDILFDEDPTIDTLDRLGWLSELQDQKPIIVNMSYHTPHLTVGARITIESVDGIQRPRVFEITKIQSDLEYPDCYVCAAVPVFDQYEQSNDYTLTNYDKINTQNSEVTSMEQPYQHINGTIVDTTPQEQKDYYNKYTFISDDNSPYSG